MMFSFSLRRKTPFDCLNLQVSVLEGCPGWRGQLHMEGGHDFSGERQKMMRMMRMRMRRMISMTSVICLRKMDHLQMMKSKMEKMEWIKLANELSFLIFYLKLRMLTMRIRTHLPTSCHTWNSWMDTIPATVETSLVYQVLNVCSIQ